MTLTIYNTFSRTHEPFVPLQHGKAAMYTCGPTVYNFAHIGNFRAYIFEDILRRYLTYKGYKVTQIMNLTDVDDKTIRDSRKEGISLTEFTDRYKKAFFEDIDTLNIERAEHYPSATEHINDMIEITQELLKKGYAYQGEDGSIYFSIARFENYGKLAHINVEELKAGARVKHDEYEKHNVADFALWKAWDESDGDVWWESPFGKGRPGWHIECSAMSMKHLGTTFDIHTGGVDNMFPHHENEIAQSESYTGKQFAKYWMHCEHLLVDGRKMSKSLGNFYTLRDLLAKGYDGRSIRYLLLGTHYRQQLNFTIESLEAARAAVERLRDFMLRMREQAAAAGHNTHHSIAQQAQSTPDMDTLIQKTKAAFESAMDNDLNISPALGALFDFVRDTNKAAITRKDAQNVVQFMQSVDTILGILHEEKEEIPAHIQELAQQRITARTRKDFAASDRLRDEITSQGYLVEDTAHGQRVRKM